MKKYLKKDEYSQSGDSTCTIENCNEMAYLEISDKEMCNKKINELNNCYWALCEKHYDEHFYNWKQGANNIFNTFLNNKEFMENVEKEIEKLMEETTMKKFNLKDYKKSDFRNVNRAMCYCLNCKIYGSYYILVEQESVNICTTCYNTLKLEPFRIIKGKTKVEELQDNFNELGFNKIIIINDKGVEHINTKFAHRNNGKINKKVLDTMENGKLLVCIVED